MQGSMAAGAAMLLPTARVLGANSDIRVAVIGTGWMGGLHCKQLKHISGVRTVALSDADLQRMDEDAQVFDQEPHKHQDFRRVLDDKNIDAVIIATPNHWHCSMAIMACQAGKHVYVQKPVSHCIWEGRKMVEAARKYDRLVQAGTQHRSDPAVAEAAADIQSGMYGKVLWVHTMMLSTRFPIGKVNTPLTVPPHIDYNLWCGPAPKTSVMRKQFHYDWHWQWNWGDGEMGNWGPHYVDDLRHLLGWNDLPQTVIAAGGRFVWDDNGQTPNMHFALFNHDGLNVVVDMRNLPAKTGTKSPSRYLKTNQGNVVVCESGTVRIARGGGWSYDTNDKRVKQYKGDGGGGHLRNFFDALRSGSRSKLNAEIEIGHLSTAMCHMANIAYRMGKQTSVEQVEQSMSEHQDAVETLKATVNQIDANHGDLTEHPLVLGPRLHFDNATETFTGPHGPEANRFLSYEMRKPFAVPEVV